MLRKLILTAVLGAVAVGTSSLSFAQGVTWGGEYRANLRQFTAKKGDGKDKVGTYINSFGALNVAYSTQTVNGWQGTATMNFEYSKEGKFVGDSDSTDSVQKKDLFSGVGTQSNNIAFKNFSVGLGNQSFGVKIGRTKYLDSVADMGGWVTAGTVGIKTSALSDDGDLSNRDYGSIGFELKGLPVVIKAGLSTQSDDSLSDEEAKDAEKSTFTYNGYGALVKFVAADFAVGLQAVGSTTEDPKYVDASSSTGATVRKKSENTKEKSVLAVGGNYNLQASANVPLNLWAGYKSLTSKVKDGVGAKSVKDDKNGAQVNVGARYSFLAGSEVGLNYAATSFEKEEGAPKSGNETNTILWLNYKLPWGTTVFATYSASEYKLDKSKETRNSIDIGLDQTF